MHASFDESFSRVLLLIDYRHDYNKFLIECIQKRRLFWRRLASRFFPGWYSFFPSFLYIQNTVTAEAATDNTNNSLSIATCSPRPRQRGLLIISNLLQPIHSIHFQRKANPGSTAQLSGTQLSGKQRSSTQRYAAQRQAAQRSSTYSATCKSSTAHRSEAERSAAPHMLRLEATCIYSSAQRM